MRYHIVSDLHLDTGMSRLRQTDADVVIIAGDLADGWHHRVPTFLAQRRCPVVLTLGNHDYISMAHDQAYDAWSTWLSRLPGPPIHLLRPGATIVIGDTRFIGCTWWSGLTWWSGSPDLRARIATMAEREIADISGTLEALLDQADIPDFAKIRGHGDQPGGFTPAVMRQIHGQETRSLESSLREPLAPGVVHTVVVTHMGPTRRSIHPQFYGSPLNPYFANDRDDLTHGVNLWVHGHTHSARDYLVPSTGCRVVCNPRGYASHKKQDRFGYQHSLVVRL